MCLLTGKAPRLLEESNLLNYVLLFGICVLLARGKKAEEWIAEKGRLKRGIFCMATLFTWSFISLSQVSTFLYFNF